MKLNYKLIFTINMSVALKSFLELIKHNQILRNNVIISSDFINSFYYANAIQISYTREFFIINIV